MRAHSCYNNPVVVELEEKDVVAEYEDIIINTENGSVADGFDLYEDVVRKAHDKQLKDPTSEGVLHSSQCYKCRRTGLHSVHKCVLLEC